LKSIQNKLEERYENLWNNLLSQNNDNIWGRNKLRTYRKHKANFEAEKYLYTYVDKCSISTFDRERISNCNLDIERGRYSKLTVEQRICRLYSSEVKDEFHFIMHCPNLSAYRVDLFESLSLVIPSFPDTCMSEIEKFKYILSSNDLDICKICILGVKKMYDLNQTLKQRL
jgi:hypothetical protein